MLNPNTPSPMEAPDDLVRELRREVEARAAGRPDLAPFVAWLRTRLDVIAGEMTPAHRSRASSTKATQVDRSLH